MSESILSASVAITLDGRELVLRYRAHAFIAYAEATGSDLLHDIRDLGESLRAVDGGSPAGIARACARLRDVFWAGLVDAQPEITRDQVARMFGFGDLGRLAAAMTKALQLSMPEPEAKPERPTKAAKQRRDGPPTDGHASGLPSATAQALPPVNSAA